MPPTDRSLTVLPIDAIASMVERYIGRAPTPIERAQMILVMRQERLLLVRASDNEAWSYARDAGVVLDAVAR